MKILDIHTHHVYKNPFEAILNLMPGDFASDFKGYCSIGYHPWYLSEYNSEDWEKFEEQVSSPQVLAIGEAGLDKLTSASMEIQERAFIKQTEIASRLNKPLIIHCVKAYNDIIRHKKEINSDVAWIIHGFRGKKELAAQLLDHGFYLSFGERYNEEALKYTPFDRMFIETDESEVGIQELYGKGALVLSMDVEELIGKIQKNISDIFF
jgi:Mg-dependent DNase